MLVRLKSEWMGRSKGTELDINDAQARVLIKRKVAEPVKEKKRATSFREAYKNRQMRASPNEK